MHPYKFTPTRTSLQTDKGMLLSSGSKKEHFLQLSCSVYPVYTEATCNQLAINWNFG